MIAEFTAAAGSAKALFDLAKAGKSAIDETKLALALSDLSSKLMEAQAASFALSEENTRLQTRIRELEQSIRDKENWVAQAEKHKLCEVAPGVFAVVDKEVVNNFQSAVKLCAHCYEKQIRSILQTTEGPHRTKILVCHHCNSKTGFDDYCYPA